MYEKSKIVLSPNYSYLSLLCCSLILAGEEGDVFVTKGTPTARDLISDDVWVLGGVRKADENMLLRNFSFDEDPASVFKCIAEIVGPEGYDPKYPENHWVHMLCLRDERGDDAVAKRLGISTDVMAALHCPIMAAIHAEFRSRDKFSAAREDPLWHTLKMVGDGLKTVMSLRTERHDFFEEHLGFYMIKIDGITKEVAFIRPSESTRKMEEPAKGLAHYLRRIKRSDVWATVVPFVKPSAGENDVSIFIPPNRRSAYNLLPLRGQPHVKWCIKQGYVATVDAAGDEFPGRAHIKYALQETLVAGELL